MYKVQKVGVNCEQKKKEIIVEESSVQTRYYSAGVENENESSLVLKAPVHHRWTN